MAKVTFRLPSEAVKYGYVEYTFDHDETGADEAGHALGVQYKRFVDNFQRGEARRPGLALQPEPTHEEAQALIVAELGASVYDEPVEEETPEWEEPPAPPSDDDWDF